MSKKNGSSAIGTKSQRERKPKRFRLPFHFWLNITKDDELEIADMIADLKERRTFSQVIRDGIRLIVSLRAGRVEVLEMLFPWIRDYYTKQQSSPADEFLRLIQQRADLLTTGPRSSVPLDLPEVSIFAADDEPAVTASEARATFAGGMGNLFDDDDDDLFD